jgi:hypothetical protein
MISEVKAFLLLRKVFCYGKWRRIGTTCRDHAVPALRRFSISTKSRYSSDRPHF